MGFKFSKLPLAMALRDALREGYSGRDLWLDMTAGITLCVLAIPTTLAVAIACGVAPEHGLYGAIIGGVLIALLGGSRLSISGPVIELAVLLYPVVHQFGIVAALQVTWMAGLILLVMGFGKLGRIIEFIPAPVTTGFITGTGVVIWGLQFKGLLGLSVIEHPKYFLERIIVMWQALPSAQLGDMLLGSVTLIISIFWSRVKIPIPSHLLAILLSSFLGVGLSFFFPEIPFNTIGTEYDGILPSFPPVIPLWQTIDLETIRNLLSSAFAIAMLCAIKALLCAMTLDRMRGTKHDPNAELIAQGIGNLVLPLFGGLASTAALSRSVANLKLGARSPIASVVHGVVMLSVILFLAPVLSYLPVSALSALLMMAAWHICDFRRFFQLLRAENRSDRLVLILCFGLTVLWDMVIAVGVGMVLAAGLAFLRNRWIIRSTRQAMFSGKVR